MDRSKGFSTFLSNTFKTALPFFLVFVTLTSCSGGGGGSGASVSATSLSGAVIDAPITGATITITQNAPLGQPGAVTLGTTTADQYGKYSLSAIPIPKTSAPIYASSQGGSVYGHENPDILLTAYLGEGQAMASAGSDLGEGNDPDLAVSQVTTAAVALGFKWRTELPDQRIPGDTDIPADTAHRTFKRDHVPDRWRNISSIRHQQHPQFRQ